MIFIQILLGAFIVILLSTLFYKLLDQTIFFEGH